MNARYLIIMSLVALLSSSSFFFPGYFQQAVEQNKLSKSITAFAFKKGLPAAYQLTYQQEEKGTSKWLTSAHQLASTDSKVAYELGLYYKSINNDKLTEQYWLVASKLKNENAITSLADFYYRNANYIQAQKIIALSYAKPEQHKILKLKIALAQGDIDAIAHLTSEQESQNTEKAFIKELSSFGLGQQRDKQTPTLTCPFSITLVAATIEDLRRWQAISEQYQHHVLSNYVCVDAIKYFPVLAMDCQRKQGTAIQCDELFWHSYSSDIASEYIAVMQPNGGANVHYGILYMDRADTTDVFAHEIAHLLGFADEYALKATHNLCRQASMTKSHNIALLTDAMIVDGEKLRVEDVKRLPWSTLISERYLTGREYVTLNETITKEGIGIFASETCSNSNTVLAVKPMHQHTALRNYKLAFPHQYQQLLDENVERFAMPSFHYNIAYGLFIKGDIESAKAWLEKSARYFNLPATKAKILKGSY